MTESIKANGSQGSESMVQSVAQQKIAGLKQRQEMKAKNIESLGKASQTTGTAGAVASQAVGIAGKVTTELATKVGTEAAKNLAAEVGGKVAGEALSKAAGAIPWVGLAISIGTTVATTAIDIKKAKEMEDGIAMANEGVAGAGKAAEQGYALGKQIKADRAEIKADKAGGTSTEASSGNAPVSTNTTTPTGGTSGGP